MHSYMNNAWIALCCCGCCRNFLVYLAFVARLSAVRVVALRTLAFDASVSTDVQCMVFDVNMGELVSKVGAMDPASVSADGRIGGLFKVAGWSTNSKGALAPDIVSLK